MISALVLLIPRSYHETECVVAIDASEFGIVWVLLQEHASRSLKSCNIWATILNNCEAHCSAYDCEALVVVETVRRV